MKTISINRNKKLKKTERALKEIKVISPKERMGIKRQQVKEYDFVCKKNNNETLQRK